MSSTDNDFELCMRVENVFLPQRGYYGLSAATGGLAGTNLLITFSN
jgi:mannose-binding lectin 1